MSDTLIKSIRYGADNTHSVKVVYDNNTLVRKIVIGAPISSVKGALNFNLGDLADVEIVGVTDNQFFVYDSDTSTWTAGTFDAADFNVSDGTVTLTNPTHYSDSDVISLVNQAYINGLDVNAGTLDSQDGAYYLNYDNFTGTPPSTYTRVNFDSDLGTVSGDILPNADSAYDIGSPALKFKDIHLSGGTIYLGNAVIKDDGNGIEANGNHLLDDTTTSSDIPEGTNKYYTDARVTTLVDASYIQSRQTPQDFSYSSLTGSPNVLDSADVTGIIIETGATDSATVSQIIVDDVDTTFVANLGFEQTSNKGSAGGYAGLDGSGTVPPTQLPSYVDDVLEYANRAAFPATGETGKIYIALDTNHSWRWSGSTYIDVTDATKLTGAEIKALYEGEADTNAFTDSEQTKLANLDPNATATDSATVSAIITQDVDQAFVNALNVDADTLDNQDGSYYLDYTNFTGTPPAGADSSQVISIINDTVDSDYVRLHETPNVPQDFAYGSLTGAPTVLDSSQVSIVIAEDVPPQDFAYGSLTGAPNVLDSADVVAIHNDLEVVYNGFDSDFADKSTTDLVEGDNLYYTDVRADSDARHAISATGSLVYNPETGVMSFTAGVGYGSNDFDSDFGDKTTDDLAEGSNLYYTDARVSDLVDSAYVQLRESPETPQDFAYSSLTGAPTVLDSSQVSIVVSEDVDSDYVRLRETPAVPQDFAYGSLTGAPTVLDSSQVSIVIAEDVPPQDFAYSSLTGAPNVLDSADVTAIANDLEVVYDGFDSDLATKSTTDVAEGDNLYYTTPRADSDARHAISASGSLNYNPDTGVISFTAGVGYGSNDFDSDFGDKTTDDLAEGSNLYYTDARVTSVVDSDYVRLRETPNVPQDFAYSSLTGAPTVLDSSQVSIVVSEDVDKAFVDALGVDADTLAGQDSSYYLNYNNLTNLPDYYDSGDFDASFAGKSTSDLTEGSNLYYTDIRVSANTDVSSNTAARHTHANKATLDAITAAYTTGEADKLAGIEAGANLYTHPVSHDFSFLTNTPTTLAGYGITDDLFDSGDFASEFPGAFTTQLDLKSTDNLSEGSSNLYYTSARVDSDIVDGFADRTTSDLDEGSNLYYTTSRANADFDTRLATKSTTDLSEGTNRYFTEARADSAFDLRISRATTDDVAEGSNLYYTTARFDSDFGDNTTSDLVEGTNLYYTEARADSAIDARVTKPFVDALNVDADTLDGIDGSVYADKYSVDSIGSLLLTKQPAENGFVNRDDSLIRFDNATRQFSIEPIGPQFQFYVDHNLFTVTDSDVTTITDTQGQWYLYYDATGTLQSTQGYTEDIITRYAWVATVYWDADSNQSIIIGDERHGNVMDAQTHLYLHNTSGTLFGSGIGVSGVIADSDGADDDQIQIAVGSGVVWDEDIKHIIPIQPKPANIPILHKTGPSGVWKKIAATDYIVTTTGTGRAAWNENTGSEWQLTELGDSDFACMHLIADNDIEESLHLVVGQSNYGSIEEARDGASIELLGLDLTGFPLEEYKSVASMIVHSKDAYTNAVKTVIRTVEGGADFIDWRQTNVGVAQSISGGTVTAWGDITGTLSNQLDLQAAIDGKLSTSGTAADASLLGGNDSAYYTDYANMQNEPFRFDSDNWDSKLAASSTDDVSEGTTNEYYLKSRVDSDISLRVNKTFVDALNVDADTLDNQDGTYYLNYNNFTNAPTIYDTAAFDSDLAERTTDDLSEGSNLYYTEGRVSANATVAANTAARHTHANKGILDNITAAYTTADSDKLAGIEDNANNYTHPATHSWSIITDTPTTLAGYGITDDLFDSGDFDVMFAADFETSFSAKSTSDLSEGTSLYYTVARVDSDISDHPDVVANTAARHTHANKAILDEIEHSFTNADYAKLEAIDSGANAYVLPVAAGSIGGVLSGTDITVDGSGNVSVNNNSHTHLYANITDAPEVLDSSQVSAIITQDVDVTFVNNLNVDADTLDLQDGTYYLDHTNFTNVPDPQLTIDGDASGNATFTNLGNATLTLTVADNSHQHLWSNITSTPTTVAGYGITDDLFDSGQWAGMFADESTSNLSEGSNLYYTTVRADSDARHAVSASGDLGYDPDTGVFSFTADPGYNTAKFDSDFGDKSTTDLTEGSNLYYTSTRANAAIDTRVNKAFVDALNVDADTLDTQDGSYYLAYGNFTGTPTVLDSSQISIVVAEDVTKVFVDALNVDADTLDNQNGTHYLDYNNFTNTPTVLDSSQISIVVAEDVDSDYVRLRETPNVPQDFAYSSLTGAPTVLDSSQVSIVIGEDVDASYVQARQDFAYTSLTGAPTVLDSSQVSTVITEDVDAAYVQARQDFAYASLTGAPTVLDSSQVSTVIQEDVDSAYVRLLETPNVPQDFAYSSLTGTPTVLDSSQISIVILEDVDAAYVQARQTNQDFAYSSLTGTPTVLDSSQVSIVVSEDVTKVFVDALNVDADTLDNQDGAYYLNYANFTGTPPSTVDSAVISAIIIEDVDSAYVQARQTNQDFAYSSLTGAPTVLDSSQVSIVITEDVDSAYVRLRETPQDFAYSSLTGAPTVLDSSQVSIVITEDVDAAYVQARQDFAYGSLTGTPTVLDSSQVSIVIAEDVDATYVRARQDFAYGSLTGAPTVLDSSQVSIVVSEDVNKSFVDALNVDADTLDNQNGTYYLAWANFTGIPDLYDSGDFDISFGGKSTSDLGEGTNLYYTEGRVTANAAVAANTAARHTHANKAILDNITAAYTTADETKVDFITITQAVNLDDIETRVNELDAAVVLQGTWAPSSGVFPGDDSATAGSSWIVSDSANVDNISFSTNDRIVAVANNASSTTYAGNWFKMDYTDQVLSVAGKIGTVTLVKGDVGLANVDNTSDANKPVSDATQTALNLKSNIASPTFTGIVTAPDITLTSLSNQAAEATALTINGSNVVGTRELGTGAFATAYVHPSDGGGNRAALTGANVYSDIEINTAGHVTSTTTRALTPGNIGAQVAGTYNTIIGTDSDINTNGGQVVDTITMTDGVIQGMSFRALTPGDIGAQVAGTYNTTIGTDSDLSLSGNEVVSAITVTDGVITSASKRALTPGNIGAQVAGTYNTIIGTDSDINTNGAQVVDTITMTDGVIQGMAFRAMTLADLGYTGDTNANEYVHPSDGVDPGAALTGATVFSDITVNAAGHVTGSATRELTAANIGAVGTESPEFTGGIGVDAITNIAASQTTLSTTTQTSVDTWAVATWASAKYTVTVTTGSARQVSELLVVHDGTTAYATEYAIIKTGSTLATFEVDISGGNVRLRATGASATSTEYSIHRVLTEV